MHIQDIDMQHFYPTGAWMVIKLYHFSREKQLNFDTEKGQYEFSTKQS